MRESEESELISFILTVSEGIVFYFQENLIFTLHVTEILRRGRATHARSWMSSSHVAPCCRPLMRHTRFAVLLATDTVCFLSFFPAAATRSSANSESKQENSLTVAQKSVFPPRRSVGFQTSLISDVFIAQTSSLISKQSCSVLSFQKFTTFTIAL